MPSYSGCQNRCRHHRLPGWPQGTAEATTAVVSDGGEWQLSGPGSVKMHAASKQPRAPALARVELAPSSHSRRSTRSHSCGTHHGRSDRQASNTPIGWRQRACRRLHAPVQRVALDLINPELSATTTGCTPTGVDVGQERPKLRTILGSEQGSLRMDSTRLRGVAVARMCEKHWTPLVLSTGLEHRQWRMTITCSGEGQAQAASCHPEGGPDQGSCSS